MTSDKALDELIGKFELVITTGLIEVIERNLPKSALDETLATHRNEAKTHLTHLLNRERLEARIDELEKMHVNINRNLGNYHAYKNRIADLKKQRDEL